MRATFLVITSMICLVPAQARTKIAILNVQQAVLSTEEGKTAAEALQKKVAPEQARLSGVQRQIQDLESQLRDQAGRNDQETAQLKARIAALTATYRCGREDDQHNVDVERTRVLNELGAKMLTVVGKYARQKHFDIVLDESDSKTSVYWRAAATDITDEVIKRYNQAARRP
jgi:outer membrane protein